MWAKISMKLSQDLGGRSAETVKGRGRLRVEIYGGTWGQSREVRGKAGFRARVK